MRIIAEISETTRKIKLPIDRVLSVNGDYQVDEIAFKLPDTYEGDFDYRTGVPRVHWKGADGAEHAEVLASVDSSGHPLWVLPAALTQGGDGVIEFSVSFSTTDESDHLTQRWKTKPAAFRNERGIGGNDEQAEDDEIYDRLASAVASVRAAQAEVEDTNAVLSSLTGSAPVPVENRSDMVDNGHLYLYTGDETGFVTGNLYYYVNGTLTNGGPYGAVTLDDTLSQSGQAADAAAVGEALDDIDADVAQIKEDLSAIQTATADDAGKALKAKAVANGKVTEWEFGETGDKNAVPLPVEPESKYGTSGQVLQTLGDGKTKWANVGEPDPTVIENAVSDWLDEHPETTTTVEDGSITEAKLATALVPTFKNNYVTPEMFGAVGDGETDDTQAIRDMFASDNTVFSFGNKTYLTDGAIDITKSCDIYFNNTTILAKNSRVPRDFEYMIGVKAAVRTFGRVNVNANTSVNVCICLAGCGRSIFDSVHVGNARIWGIWVDNRTNGNNSLKFNILSAGSCGFKVKAKAKVSGSSLLISDMTFTKGVRTMYRSLFSTAMPYNHMYCVIDDSLFTANHLANRYVFTEKSAFVLDDGDDYNITGTFTPKQIPSGYDSEDGRDVFIPIGGGINFQSASSEGVFDIEKFVSMSNAMSARIMMGYGGRIGVYSTEYDGYAFLCGAMSLVVEYIYAEAMGSGMNARFGNGYDAIYVIATSTCAVQLIDSFRFPLLQGNLINIDTQLSVAHSSTYYNFGYGTYLASKKLNGLNYGENTASFKMNIDEYSPRLVTLDFNGFTGNNITLRLVETNPKNMPVFEPVTIYVCKRHPSDTTYNNLGIALSSNLVDAGFTLKGAIDNNLVIHPSDYNRYFKITIMLFRYTKEFCVTAEPLTFVDNTQTEGT